LLHWAIDRVDQHVREPQSVIGDFAAQFATEETSVIVQSDQP
jgi:hypothetical protein